MTAVDIFKSTYPIVAVESSWENSSPRGPLSQFNLQDFGEGIFPLVEQKGYTKQTTTVEVEQGLHYQLTRHQFQLQDHIVDGGYSPYTFWRWSIKPLFHFK